LEDLAGIGVGVGAGTRVAVGPVFGVGVGAGTRVAVGAGIVVGVGAGIVGVGAVIGIANYCIQGTGVADGQGTGVEDVADWHIRTNVNSSCSSSKHSLTSSEDKILY